LARRRTIYITINSSHLPQRNGCLLCQFFGTSSPPWASSKGDGGIQRWFDNEYSKIHTGRYLLALGRILGDEDQATAYIRPIGGRGNHRKYLNLVSREILSRLNTF
jgi:hypothetical protein